MEPVEPRDEDTMNPPESRSSEPADVPARPVPTRTVAAKRAAAENAPAKRVAAKRVAVKKTPEKKAPAKKVPAKKVPSTRVVASQTPTKRAPTKREPPRKAPAKRAPADRVPTPSAPVEGETAQKPAASRPSTGPLPQRREPAISFPRPQRPRTAEPGIPPRKIADPRFDGAQFESFALPGARFQPSRPEEIVVADSNVAPVRRRPRGARRPKSAVASAGYALAVGLICFGLWTVLDARQLFNSATVSPLGTRRSVSMTFLRPIASFEEFFGLDRAVNGGNRALGRTSTGTPGIGTPPPATSNPPLPSTVPSTVPTTVPVQGGGHTKPPHVGPPPIAQPTSARPLVILQIGDSIGEDLGYGLASTIGGDPLIRFVQGSVGDTGLSNVAYYDWPAKLAQQLRQFHPKLVLVMLGANDWQAFYVNGVPAQPGSPAWISAYTERVAAMMAETTAAGARLVWVGLPVMQSPDFSRDVAVLDTIFRTQARLHPGTVFVPTWKLFANSSGKYSEYLQVDGSLVEVRVADGVHIAPPGGTGLLGSYVVRRIDAIWHIHI